MTDRDTRPHRGSILGYLIFAMGLNPSNEGADLLDMRPSAISRVLNGTNPTPVALLRKIEFIVDEQRAMPTMIGGPKADSNFRIAHAVLDGRLDREDSTLAYWGTKPIQYPVDDFKVEHRDVWTDGYLSSRIERLHIPDAPSPIAAAARIAGLSVNDMAFVTNSTATRIRDLLSGSSRPDRSDWDAVFAAYNSHIGEETPIGLGREWMCNPDRRRKIEMAYCDGAPPELTYFDLGEEA